VGNRRKIHGSRPHAEKCAVCGRGTGKLKRQVRLPDSRMACGGCVEAGHLAKRMACGHYAMPGNLVVREGFGFTCRACAADTLARLGV
jgi:hypothetical protein